MEADRAAEIAGYFYRDIQFKRTRRVESCEHFAAEINFLFPLFQRLTLQSGSVINI